MASPVPRPPTRIAHLVAMLAALLASAPLPAADGGWRPVDEHWYEFLINGAKAGWMRETVDEQEGTGHLRTVVESQLSIERGAQAMRVTSRTEFVETGAGRPVEVRSEQRQDSHGSTTRWAFEDGRIVQTVRQAGRETTTELPAPQGVWFTPRAADRFARERRKAGADTCEYRLLDPEHGLEPVTVRSRRVGEGTYPFDGRELSVEIWSTTTDVLPIETTEQFSLDGYLVHQRMPMLGGTMEVRIARRDDAVKPEAGGPELLVRTFVQLAGPIERVDRARRARLRLRTGDGPMPPLPTAGAQRVVVAAEPGAVELDIDLDRRLPAAVEELADPAYRAPSVMIGSDDPLVMKLATSATRNLEEDPRRRAEALRTRVARHISRKGLATAFASAAETAQMRRGDCSEHAVLLCAMLRAEGIPARVASGLVYVEQFAGARECFGWHMWTQALIDDAWVDLDATLPVPYHAGHVLVSTTALADGAGSSDLAAMVLLMGNLEIDVLDVGYETPAGMEAK